MGVVVFYFFLFHSGGKSRNIKSCERSKNMVTFLKECVKDLKVVWWLATYTIYILYAAMQIW